MALTKRDGTMNTTDSAGATDCTGTIYTGTIYTGTVGEKTKDRGFVRSLRPWS